MRDLQIFARATRFCFWLLGERRRGEKNCRFFAGIMVIIEKFLRKEGAAVGAREQVPKPSFRGREQVPWRKQQSPAGSRSRGGNNSQGNSSPRPGADPVEETAVPGREQVPSRKQQSPPSRHYPNLGHPIELDCEGGRTDGSRQKCCLKSLKI